ncbi:aminoglycoside phosphotransferase family protein [Spirilliplanes yamanashiensis]|uniref:Hydroxyurea phosphotransferase n=1 Tax=Spirilliplanes yamanashiensis TaxID=42233 RepID=A0A8J4DKE2_9ACTN|nr:aminoglycoside phosphotransferase family protein [Spirilliplanes yamanashiensis]MDP9818747.1 streptomycin 6-kinase [Spirilliplanes yamanashiensis]GIJ05202.1 hydroxyurea phosphotransferase [Spirilliplanes yamanashiensis]
MISVPPRLRARAAAVWGAEGARWADALPATAADVAARWQLTLGPAYPPSLNWVARARRADGTPAVLKLGVPSAGHLAGEAAALAAWAGRGAVRLLARDDERGALLLERAEPGGTAAALVPADDDAATDALIAAIRRLHRPAPPGVALPELAARRGAFAANLREWPGSVPVPLVRRADALFGELVAAPTGRVVLHGDLHHDNLLRAGREPWLAIDPHGLVGDPSYEPAALLYNPLGAAAGAVGAVDAVALLPRRIERLAAGLGADRDRVVAWGFVQAVLSEVWTADTGGPPDGRPLAVAEALLPLLR